jgi:hypothetical protein
MSLLRRMLSWNQANRPTANEAIVDKYFDTIMTRDSAILDENVRAWNPSGNLKPLTHVPTTLPSISSDENKAHIANPFYRKVQEYGTHVLFTAKTIPLEDYRIVEDNAFQTKTCVHCANPNITTHCSQCSSMLYCSKECRDLHNESHAALCGEHMTNAQPTYTILTVPHATCPADPQLEYMHPCDVKSEELARAIETKISSGNVHVHVSTTPRTKTDANRRWARENTEYRKELTRMIVDKKKADVRVVVLDIHSFSPESEAWGRYDTVLLDTHREGPLMYTENLRKNIESNDLRVTTMHGSYVNDIVYEARTLGVVSVLVQVNENISADKLNRLAKAVAAWCARV